MLERGRESRVSGQDSGSTSLKQYGSYDPDTCTWRTSQQSEIGDSQLSSHRFTKSGMTRDGLLYELPTSARPTSERDGSPLLLLPTVRAADGGRGPTLKSTVHEGGDDLVTTVMKLYQENPDVYREHPEWRGEKSPVLFKTPTANLGSNGSAQHPDQRKAGGHGPTLDDEVCFLLNVTPEDAEVEGPHSPAEWWNEYGPAVYRWECLTGKAAPIPVIRGPRGGRKLNPRFCEWMMGLPDGWVTAVEGVSVNEQISRIGNGVVPAQAYYAFKLLRDAVPDPEPEREQVHEQQSIW
jgi:hypothetical protein